MAGREGGAAAQAILTICREHADTGISNDQLREAVQAQMQLPDDQYVAALNELLAKTRLEAMESMGGMVFRAHDPVKATKLRGLSTEDMLVYQHIEKSGARGLWTREIRKQTNLQQNLMTKSLKTLEARDLIKPVRSVNDGTKKMYVLFDVTPAHEITGGLWFTGDEMDTELISVLQNQCKQYIVERGPATVDDVTDAVRAARIVNEPVDAAHIEAIIKTLLFDGEVERTVSAEGDEAYRKAIVGIPETTEFTSFPCGVCPVIEECTDGGKVSPATCIYFANYLDF